MSRYEKCKAFKEAYESKHGSVDPDKLSGNGYEMSDWIKYGFILHYMQGYEDAQEEMKHSVRRFSYEERDDGK